MVVACGVVSVGPSSAQESLPSCADYAVYAPRWWQERLQMWSGTDAHILTHEKGLDWNRRRVWESIVLVKLYVREHEVR